MIATLFFLFFMLLIPKKFKKVGIKLIIENKKQGLFLFLLSKVLWWFLFLQITKIWIPDFEIYVYAFVVIGAAYKFYKDRKYLTFGLTKKPSL